MDCLGQQLVGLLRMGVYLQLVDLVDEILIVKTKKRANEMSWPNHNWVYLQGTMMPR